MNDVYTFINLLYNCKCSEHNRDIIITTIRLKSPASRMFTQSFIQTQIKENIKAPRRVVGLCAGNSPLSLAFPHKGPVTRKMFPFDDATVKQTNSICTAKIFFRRPL